MAGIGIPELTKRVDKLEQTVTALLELLHDRRLIADDDLPVESLDVDLDAVRER